ncbi:MAG: hypothetical protein ABJN42_09805 [Roseibium sp.]|uniref:hypothetical protein n=1 Tax=Roseibium sp. TaxID=1936156 RepID=UPI003296DAF6
MTEATTTAACAALRIAASERDPEAVLLAVAEIRADEIGPDNIDDLTMAVVLSAPQTAEVMADFLRRPGIGLAIAKHLPPPHNRDRGMRIKTICALMAARVDQEILRKTLRSQGVVIRNHFARVMAVKGIPERPLAPILARAWHSDYFKTGYTKSLAHKTASWGLEANRSLFLSIFTAIAGAIVFSFIYPLLFAEPGKLMLLFLSVLAGIATWILSFIVGRILDHL